MSAAEIITRRRKWSAAERAALLAEVEAEGRKVGPVARCHGISDRSIGGTPHELHTMTQTQADRPAAA